MRLIKIYILYLYLSIGPFSQSVVYFKVFQWKYLGIFKDVRVVVDTTTRVVLLWWGRCYNVVT